MKITLFFCAGNYAETLGIHKISEMNGVGWRMPWTSIAFCIAALGMIGAPLTAGYISKLYLNQGAEIADQMWASGVLTVSSLFNATYFLPIMYRFWFKTQPQTWVQERIYARGRWETHGLLLIPPLVSAAATLVAGIFADTDWSPLYWVKLIVKREYLL